MCVCVCVFVVYMSLCKCEFICLSKHVLNVRRTVPMRNAKVILGVCACIGVCVGVYYANTYLV